MCVIFIANEKRVPDEMVYAGFDANKDGAGYSFQDVVQGRNVVRWEKGIDSADEMVTAAQEIPIPYILHFRIASVGGTKKGLTHPFCVNAQASTELSGYGEDPVLFHNGHWHSWDSTLREAVFRHGIKVPEYGKWSDSRAMALLAHYFGVGILDLLNLQSYNRYAVMWPDPGKVLTYGDTWYFKNGIYCSNLSWESRGSLPRSRQGSFSGSGSGSGSSPYTSPPASMAGGGVSQEPTEGGPGGSTQTTPFRESDSGGLTLEELAVSTLDHMNKKQVKRLRKKRLQGKHLLTQLEEEILHQDGLRQAQKFFARTGDATVH